MNVYRCNFINIVDGDTFDLELDLGFSIKITERVRLYVDTPEHFGRNASEEGRNATQFVRDWVKTRENLDGTFYYHSMQYNYLQAAAGRCIGNVTFLDKETSEIHSLSQDLKEHGFIQ